MNVQIGFYSDEETARLRSQVSVGKLLECGDVARWWCTHIAECMPTAVIQSPRPPVALPAAPVPEILQIEAESELGRMTLAEFLAHPDSGARGFVVARRGEILCEEYPGMRPDEPHLWASCAKPTAGLMIEMLIEDGLIGDDALIGDHLPSLRGTDWHDVTVRDAMDMTPGMDSEENNETRANPDSIAIRAFLAEFGTPFRGRQETLLNVLQESRRIRPAGELFEYGSPCTQVLVLLAEAVSGRPWAELFRDRVWRHLGAEAPLLAHQSPDGVALAHGVISSRLRDMVRFGMLFTPSATAVADRPVVSPDTLARIRGDVRGGDFFAKGYDGPVFHDLLGVTDMIGNSRQWDCIWPDGDMFKGGFMSQGLYVSPDRDFVIAYFSTSPSGSLARYLRPIATSPLLG